MEKQSQAHRKVLIFRHWSRKSYGVFNSLGKIIRVGVLCLAYSILATPCSAQGDRDTLQHRETISGHELDEVVVSAQRSPVVQSQLMRVVQVITRAEIEQSPARDVASLLQNVRGVDIRKRGTFGIQADVSIRGGTFDQTLILINGINVTDPQTGHHSMNLPVDLKGIERIEVLKGPGARIFGPNAFNGAINIITNQPGREHINATLLGGEYGLGSASASAGFNAGPLKNFISINGMTSDGFIENTDFEAGTIFLRSVTEIGASHIDIQAGYNEKAFGANSFYTPRFPNQFEETRTRFVSLQLLPTGEPNLKATVFWRRHHDRFELFRNYANAPAWYINHNYHMSDVAGASLNWNHTGRFGQTSAGVDYRFEHIFSNVIGHPLHVQRKVQGYDSIYFTHSYQRSGFSLMAEQSLFRGPFSLSAGVLAYINPELDNNITLFPGIDVGFQFADNWRWFSSVGRTLRLPTFTDLFYRDRAHVGNHLLQPEKAISLETGVKSKIGGIDFELAVFRRWGSDMIDWIMAPGDEQWRSMNLTKVNITGIETGARVPLRHISLLKRLNPTLNINYSYIHSDKASGELISKYALDHLRHKLDIGITHNITSRSGATWRVSWQDRAGGFMLFSDGVFQDQQAFDPMWMADLKMFYNLNRWRIFAEASNLFDAYHVSIANVPQPGRWVRVGVNFNLNFSAP